MSLYQSLSRYLNGLSLRQRFLVAPLLALLVIVAVMLLLTLEMRRQDQLQEELLAVELNALSGLSDLMSVLSSEHMALFKLMLEAKDADEEILYERSIKHLDRIRGISNNLKQSMNLGYGNAVLNSELLAELATAVESYQQQTSAAVELTTVDPGLAAEKLIIANDAYIALSETLDKTLEQGGNRLLESMNAYKQKSRQEIIMIGVSGVGIVAALLLLSLWLSRLLSNTLVRQLDALAGLSRRAGADTVPPARNNPVASMSGVIDSFRTSLSKLRQSEASLARANAELRDHQSELESRIDERTADLALAKEKAESASVAKSAFLANMSHELRTPLNAILGYAQILVGDADMDKRQKRGAKTILQSGQHLLSVINDILDLSKIEAGKLELFPQVVNMPEFLSSVVDIMQVRAQQGETELSTDIPEDLPATVRIDEKRLRQILLNLLGNAIRFTERGEVMLKVAVAGSSQTQTRLVFEVIDTGVGIAEEDLEKIFESFEQVGAAGSRTGGTGLGLAIVKRLITLMDGDISVSSELGRGSRFCFSIPVTVTTEEAAASVQKPLPMGYQGRQRRILVVDDLSTNRAIQADMLAPLGFLLRQADDGHEALAIAADWQPDLITMDLIMPGMGGIEAIGQLRRRPESTHTPIMVISAGTDDDDAKALDAGANVFLQKPFEQRGYLNQVGELLQLQWSYGDDAGVAEEPVEMVVPEPGEMSALLKAALSGNMRDVRAQADSLRARNSSYAPFANQLHGLADNYQSKAIVQLVKRHCGNGEKA